MTASRFGTSEWTIAPIASLDEIDDVIELERESFSKPWTRDMYVAELSNRDVSSLYLAKDADRHPIGFCCFWRVLDELHINNLAVTPAMRRRGLGTALLVRALDEGYRLGARRALLEVRQSNMAARQLYEALGFRPNGVRREYYSEPVEDALMLTVALPLLVG